MTSLGFGRDASGGGVHHRLEPGEEILVSVLRVAGEIRLELRDPLQELPESRLGDLVGGESVAFLFQVAGVEDLLELPGDGLGEHRLVQVDRFAHQGKSGAGHHGAGGAQVVDEALLAERLVGEIAVPLLLLKVAAQAVDAALDPGPTQEIGQLLVGGVRLIDEQVRARLRLRRQDLGPEERRMQGGALLADGRPEEGGDQVLVRSRHLRLHDALGDLERGLVPGDHVLVVLAPVDDLDVVHRDHRQPVVHAVEVAPALEIADHHVGAEAVGDLEVGLDVLRPAAGQRPLHVRQQRAEVPHFVVLGDDGEAPDLLHLKMIARALRQVVVSAARHHHLDLVPLDQLVEDHARADGVSHALPDDPVQDAHASVSYAIRSRTRGRSDRGASPMATAARNRASPASSRDSFAACSSASTSPARTGSPTRLRSSRPAAGSTASSFRARPAPSSTAARPTCSASIAVKTPERPAWKSRRKRGCGSSEGSSTTRGLPPWASITSANLRSALPSARAFSRRARAATASAVPPNRSISTPRRRVSSRTSEGPRLRRTSMDSRTSTALPTALPSGASMEVSSATQPRPIERQRSTMVRARSRASSSVFMNAPRPTFTSSTRASIPSASFLLKMLEAISGTDSTVAVASRSAYSLRSAGAICAVCPIRQSPSRSTSSVKRCVERSTRNPGMLSSLSSVPPVCPRPRPEIIGTRTPQTAASGASGMEILSPTPPVECLSTLRPGMRERSSTSPERSMASNQCGSSARRSMPRKNTAIRNAASCSSATSPVVAPRTRNRSSSGVRMPPSRFFRIRS